MTEIQLATMVSSIGQVARRVGKDFEDQQTAFERRRLADEALVEAVIENARPAFPAIANVIPGVDSSGVALLKRKTKDECEVTLYLLADGEFMETWEAWDVFDEAVVTHRHRRTVAYVAERYALSQIVEGVHLAVVKQVGRRMPSTVKANEGAAKVEAILTLLGVAPKKPQLVDDIPF